MAWAALTPEVASAIGSLVSAGSSVVGNIHSMVQGIDKSVVCGIEISNCTRYLLKSEGYYSAWGYIDKPPVSVSPGIKEAFIGVKANGTTTGTTGVAVWKVGNTRTRLLVMWSVPWNHNHHYNVLAVGFVEGKVELENETYRTMYFKRETWFRRQDFANDKYCSPVEIKHAKHKFKVQGNMGTSHKCEAAVEILPMVEDVIADRLKSALFDYRKKPEQNPKQYPEQNPKQYRRQCPNQLKPEREPNYLKNFLSLQLGDILSFMLFLACIGITVVVTIIFCLTLLYLLYYFLSGIYLYLTSPWLSILYYTMAAAGLVALLYLLYLCSPFWTCITITVVMTITFCLTWFYLMYHFLAVIFFFILPG